MAINDGSANAPAGSPQLPNLLVTYGANRPAWNVAGVDYYVGVPQGLSLRKSCDDLDGGGIGRYD